MSRITQVLITAITLIAAVTIGIVDVTGYLPEITILALIPIIAGTYYLGFGYGVFVAMIAAVSELIAHLLLETGARHTEVIANTISHTFIYILTAALIARLVRQLGTITRLEEQRNNDIDIAQKVHGSVFAPIPSQFGNMSIGSKVAFARELGGDYYFVTSIEERLFICLADISGKSIAAALFAALLNQSVTESLEHTSDLSALVDRINSRISSAFPEDMFVTMFCALISADELSYVNAGHPPPLLYSNQEGSLKLLQSRHALPIGIIPELKIESAIESFRPGEVLLATTDGITESRAFRDRPQEKLKEVLKQNADAEAQDLTDHIFAKAVPEDMKNPLDDVIVICIKRQS